MRLITPNRSLAFAATIVALLAGCAHRQVAVVPPAPAAPPPPRPVLAPELASVVPPALGPDGRYQTINRDIGPEQTAWHVRAALNVAAIGCRGPADSGLATAYNRLLAAQRAGLDKDNKAVEAIYRSRFGKAWQDQHDAYMTRLYNFFAMPAAKVAFCETADRVAQEAAALPAGGFDGYAQRALPELEAPFVAVYQRISDYRTEVAAWDARYGGGATRLATAAPVAGPAPAVTIALPDPAPSVPTKKARAAAKPPPVLAYDHVEALVNWAPSPERMAFR